MPSLSEMFFKILDKVKLYSTKPMNMIYPGCMDVLLVVMLVIVPLFKFRSDSVLLTIPLNPIKGHQNGDDQYIGHIHLPESKAK
jgi:hypothetical protein